MTTHVTPDITSDDTHESAIRNWGFDSVMLGLATVLFATVTAAASILITLPEALEALAIPAFGAPWITSTHDAPLAPKESDPPARCARSAGGQP